MRTARQVLREHIQVTATEAEYIVAAMEAYGKALVKEVRQGGYASIEQEDGSFPWLVWDDEALNNLVK